MTYARNYQTQAMKAKKFLKIAIIGVGHVGAATAFALVLQDLADEIVLVDTDQRKADGEATDLSHAALFASNHPDVHAGTLSECENSAIVIITAGNAQTYGETGRPLLEANLKIMKQVAPQIGAIAPRAILIIAAHPNEVLTYAASRLSGIPSHRVIGFGTVLDTTVFKHELAKHYTVDPLDVHATIVGQHARSEMPVWSTICIDGLPLRSYCEQAGTKFKNDEVVSCFLKAKEASFDVLERKGNPGYSMAVGIVAIVKAILRDENTLMTVALAGHYLGVPETALSVSARLSRSGAKQLPGWSDDWLEEEGMRLCAEEVRAQIDSLGILQKMAA